MNVKVSNNEDDFEAVVKAQLMRQYRNGLKTGMYTMSKTVMDKIDTFNGNNADELLAEIRQLVSVMLNQKELESNEKH